jgi:hypothetical protein
MATIPKADPNAVSLDDAFQQAMAGPSKPTGEPGSPPPVDVDAPFGRDASGKPIAKYGLTRAGKPRRTPGGSRGGGTPAGQRVVTVDVLGTESKAQAEGSKPPQPDKPKPAPKDYSSDLSDFANAIWFGQTAIASLSGGLSKIPVVGKFIPSEDRMNAQAALFRTQTPQLVAAINMAAQNNAKARKFAESIAGGEATWVLMAGFLAMPFVAQTAFLWQGTLEAHEMPSEHELAKHNQGLMSEFMASMSAQMEAAVREAQAQQAGSAPEQPEPGNGQAGHDSTFAGVSQPGF